MRLFLPRFSASISNFGIVLTAADFDDNKIHAISGTGPSSGVASFDFRVK